jgi:hypothetical protein
MKRASKGSSSFSTLLFLGVIALGTILAVGWNVNVHFKSKRLEGIARPLQEACQTPAGCAQAPGGWTKDGESWQKDGEPLGMRYKASPSEFKIEWHIATDVWLAASGGKGKELKIAREFE